MQGELWHDPNSPPLVFGDLVQDCDVRSEGREANNCKGTHRQLLRKLVAVQAPIQQDQAGEEEEECKVSLAMLNLISQRSGCLFRDRDKEAKKCKVIQGQPR